LFCFCTAESPLFLFLFLFLFLIVLVSITEAAMAIPSKSSRLLIRDHHIEDIGFRQFATIGLRSFSSIA
jgi:hypothetical protein